MTSPVPNSVPAMDVVHTVKSGSPLILSVSVYASLPSISPSGAIPFT